MKKIALLATSLTALLATSTSASELTIDIGNNAFRTEFITSELGRDSEFSIAALVTDNDSQSDVNVYSAKALVKGNIEGSKYVNAALGVKAYYLDVDSDDDYGFGLGAELAFQLPSNPRAQLEGHYYYSPGITVSGDVDYLSDFNIRAAYKLLKNGEVYLGYRDLKAEHKSGYSMELSKGLNIGFKFLF